MDNYIHKENDTPQNGSFTFNVLILTRHFDYLTVRRFAYFNTAGKCLIRVQTQN